jgi:hypothetical protein
VAFYGADKRRLSEPWSPWLEEGYNGAKPNSCHVCALLSRKNHPAPGTLGRRLSETEGFTVRTVSEVPDSLDSAEALVLNSISTTSGSIPEDRVLRFVTGGGGLFAVHDAVYPYGGNREFVAACGIRAAYGATQTVRTPEGLRTQVVLAVGDPTDPMQRFPVRPMPEGAGHPLRGRGRV